MAKYKTAVGEVGAEQRVSAMKSKIKEFILTELLSGKHRESILRKVQEEISKFTNGISDRYEAEAYKKELTEFAKEAYLMASDRTFMMSALTMSAVLSEKKEITAGQKRFATSGYGLYSEELRDKKYDELQEKTRKFMSEYASFDGSKSYNFASSGGEGGASFERYLSDKKALIAKGVRIVYIPPHANCSKRCQPYQGKLYSLDGTSGSIEV